MKFTRKTKGIWFAWYPVIIGSTFLSNRTYAWLEYVSWYRWGSNSITYDKLTAHKSQKG